MMGADTNRLVKNTTMKTKKVIKMQANFSPLRRDKQMRTSQRVGDHTYESSSSATFRATVQYQGNRMSLSALRTYDLDS